MTIRNVLMTVDAAGGVWTYALELARALRTLGVTVTFAIMGPPPRNEQRVELDLPCFEQSFKLEWMPGCWEDVRDAGDWLLGIERECKPDLIHLNGYVHAALPWKAPAIVVAHSCVLSWWQAVHGGPAPEDWDTYRSLVTRGLRAASMIIAPSRTMLQAIGANYTDVHGRTRVIYNGTNAPAFHDGAPLETIFAAGRMWDKAKNLSLLDSLAARLRFPVQIAGDSGHNSGPGAARFPGQLAPGHVHARMREAAIFASPARYEPFGLAVLEAARSNCALVLSDIPSFREIWEDSAIFIPADDADAWLYGLNELCDDTTRMRTLAQKARERAAIFDSHRMATEYVEAYQEVVN